jgi:hypothetical protein
LNTLITTIADLVRSGIDVTIRAPSNASNDQPYALDLIRIMKNAPQNNKGDRWKLAFARAQMFEQRFNTSDETVKRMVARKEGKEWLEIRDDEELMVVIQEPLVQAYPDVVVTNTTPWRVDLGRLFKRARTFAASDQWPRLNRKLFANRSK